MADHWWECLPWRMKVKIRVNFLKKTWHWNKILLNSITLILFLQSGSIDDTPLGDLTVVLCGNTVGSLFVVTGASCFTLTKLVNPCKVQPLEGGALEEDTPPIQHPKEVTSHPPTSWGVVHYRVSTVNQNSHKFNGTGWQKSKMYCLVELNHHICLGFGVNSHDMVADYGFFPWWMEHLLEGTWGNRCVLGTLLVE